MILPLPLLLLPLVVVASMLNEVVVATQDDSGTPCSDELRNISAFPGEKDYEKGSDMYNFEFAHIRPAFIAFPQSTEDVQRCLKCSKDNAVPCVVKSGGHSSGGYSTIASPGFVIHLGKMNKVSIDGSMATIQAGALWGDIYNIMKKKNYLITGGVCPTVGVAGFTLGGGHGLLGRLYGLACDNIVSMVMVTANGSDVVHVNESVNSELFWALRGGGGGNFGIVTEFLFTLHRHPSQQYVRMSLKFEEGNKILKKAFTLVGELESALADGVHSVPSLSRKSSSIEFHLDFLYFDSQHDHLVSTITQLMFLAKEIKYNYYKSYYNLLDEITQHYGKPVEMIGCFLSAFDEDVVEVFLSSPFLEGCSVYFTHLGGAIRHGKRNKAYFFQSAIFHYYISCKHDWNKEYTVFGDSLRTALEEKGHCLGYYVNDIYPVVNWQEKYYGNNYHRLTKIKEKWNSASSSFFHFSQEIGSNYTHTETPRSNTCKIVSELDKMWRIFVSVRKCLIMQL